MDRTANNQKIATPESIKSDLDTKGYAQINLATIGKSLPGFAELMGTSIKWLKNGNVRFIRNGKTVGMLVCSNGTNTITFTK